MKTCVHLWWYLAEFFVEWEMFQTEVVGENKNTRFIFGNFFRESCRLWDNVEKCGARQAPDDNITGYIRIACWITKVTNTHSGYVIPIAFSQQLWLHERIIMLQYTYIGYLGFSCKQRQVTVTLWMVTSLWQEINL